MTTLRLHAKPLLDFIAAHVRDGMRAVRVTNAVMPVLEAFVERDYAFRPFREEDLDMIRADLEHLLGMAVTKVRTLSFVGLLERRPDEADAARAERVAAEIAAIDERLVDFDDLLGDFEAWCSWHVSEELADAFLEAVDAALPDSSSVDPVRRGALAGMVTSYMELQGMALLAAAVGDDVVLERLLPALRWLSRCMPLGGLKAEPGVVMIMIA